MGSGHRRPATAFLVLETVVVALLQLLLLLASVPQTQSQWLSKEVARWAITEFERMEAERLRAGHRGTDRRAAYPFVSGDGFREYCSPHVCEDYNRCRMDPTKVKDGECVFVKSDLFDFFGKEVARRIAGKYVVVSHNGDLSAPDGQSDVGGLGMPRYVTSDILRDEYERGRLLGLHAQNLWWANSTKGQPRPAFMHCLPIGFENRQYKIGSRVRLYADALREHVLNKPVKTAAERDKMPLLLVAFYPKSRVPDRRKVLTALGALPPRGQNKPTNPFYNETDLSHAEWLASVNEHKFVLSPFGHGLDTHRVAEVLLMGGIPVMRKSTIASCLDDSDNVVNGVTRGSLPIVVLDSWANLTKDRLDREWERLSKVPPSTWDYKRLFMEHWLRRLGATQNVTLTPPPSGLQQ
jgi:hypothetical protein